jgi:hypothetical protein
MGDDSGLKGGRVVISGTHVAGLRLARNAIGVTFDFDSDRVTVRAPTLRKPIQVRAADISFVAFEDGGSMSNVAAIALLGLFAFGARRHGTMVTVALPKGDAVIAVRDPIGRIRTQLQAAVAACPSLEGRIIDGSPSTHTLEGAADGRAQASATSDPTLLGELERLADLRDRGVIDDDEFATLKEAIINGLG